MYIFSSCGSRNSRKTPSCDTSLDGNSLFARIAADATRKKLKNWNKKFELRQPKIEKNGEKKIKLKMV